MWRHLRRGQGGGRRGLRNLPDFRSRWAKAASEGCHPLKPAFPGSCGGTWNLWPAGGLGRLG